MPDSQFADDRGRQDDASVRDAYERTADLLGYIALGTPVHEVLMIAYGRGNTRGFADAVAMYGEHRVAA